MASEAPKIDALLTLIAESPERVLSLLNSLHESDQAKALALSQSADENGYTLLHAAVSYGHTDVARVLVQKFGLGVNVRDEDQESPLFAAETVPALELLVNELGADITLTNSDGQTAREKMEEDMEWLDSIAWLRQKEGLPPIEAARAGADSQESLPELPRNMQLNMSLQPDADGEGDAELKRQLDQIVASGILDTKEGSDAVQQAIMEAVQRAAPDVLDGDVGQGTPKKRA